MRREDAALEARRAQDATAALRERAEKHLLTQVACLAAWLCCVPAYLGVCHTTYVAALQSTDGPSNLSTNVLLYVIACVPWLWLWRYPIQRSRVARRSWWRRSRPAHRRKTKASGRKFHMIYDSGGFALSMFQPGGTVLEF